MRMLRVAVVDADVQNCQELCALLEQASIPVAPLYSLEDLHEHLRKEQVRVLIVDLDTLPVDNNFFRNLKKQNPDLCYLVSLQPHIPPGPAGGHGIAYLRQPGQTVKFRGAFLLA